MAAILRALPHELLDIIIGQLDGAQGDLAALRSVNRRFYEIIGPSVFFKRVIIRSKRKNLESVTLVFRNPEYARCVHEIAVEIYPQPDETHEDDCICLGWMSDKLFQNGRKCMPKPWCDLLADKENRIVLPNLKRLTALYPDEYNLSDSLHGDFSPVEVRPNYSESSSLKTLYARFRPSMEYSLRSLADLADWAYRCVQGVPRETTPDKIEAPIIEIKRYPILQFSRYGNEVCRGRFAHVEKLKLGLSYAQIYCDGMRLLQPSAMRSMHAKLQLAKFLSFNFHNLESLHIYAPPQFKHLYVDDINDMSISGGDWIAFTINFLPSRHYPRRGLKELILEDFALIPQLDVLSHLKPLPDHLILKNCSMSLSPGPSPKPHLSVDGAWKSLFDKLNTSMIRNENKPLLGPDKTLKVYGGPSGDVEGHPSAFTTLTPMPDSEIPPNRRISAWRVAETYIETDAPPAYWKYQDVLKRAKFS